MGGIGPIQIREVGCTKKRELGRNGIRSVDLIVDYFVIQASSILFVVKAASFIIYLVTYTLRGI